MLGDAGYRSPCLSHAKRALYHLSYIPVMLFIGRLICNQSVKRWVGWALSLAPLSVMPEFKRPEQTESVRRLPSRRSGATLRSLEINLSAQNRARRIPTHYWLKTEYPKRSTDPLASKLVVLHHKFTNTISTRKHQMRKW